VAGQGLTQECDEGHTDSLYRDLRCPTVGHRLELSGQGKRPRPRPGRGAEMATIANNPYIYARLAEESLEFDAVAQAAIDEGRRLDEYQARTVARWYGGSLGPLATLSQRGVARRGDLIAQCQQIMRTPGVVDFFPRAEADLRALIAWARTATTRDPGWER